jgi:tripartite-type tricarboxylate transporter receptor subunit TctC
VAHSAPDGHTLVSGTSSTQLLLPYLRKDLPFDPVRDFTPVTQLYSATTVLVANAALPVTSLREFIEYARKNPGKLSYASAGFGTTFHFCGELFKDITKTFIVHVPYRGGGPALVDTLSGQVDMSFPTLSAAAPHVKSGSLKALAITGATRSDILPDVPTMAQAGVKNFVFVQWLALLAPAGTPREIVAKLNTSLNAALNSRETRHKFEEQGFEPFPTSPEETSRFLAGEIKRYASLIKSKGIKLE